MAVDVTGALSARGLVPSIHASKPNQASARGSVEVASAKGGWTHHELVAAAVEVEVVE